MKLLRQALCVALLSIASYQPVRMAGPITMPTADWYSSIVCSAFFHWYVTGKWSEPSTGMCSSD